MWIAGWTVECGVWSCNRFGLLFGLSLEQSRASDSEGLQDIINHLNSIDHLNSIGPSE